MCVQPIIKCTLYISSDKELYPSAAIEMKQNTSLVYRKPVNDTIPINDNI